MASITAVASLDSKVSGTGATVDFATAKRNVSAVLANTGLITGGVAGIEASQDGVTWVSMASIVIDQGRVRGYDNTTGAYRYWRAVVVDTIRGGGSLSVTFMEAD